MTARDRAVEALAEGMCARASSPCGECWANAERLLASPALRDLLASERAKALREAADEVTAECSRTDADCFCGSSDWLLDRADREVQP